MFVSSSPAQADFKVWLPDVNFGEVAIEALGDVGVDPNPDKSGEQSHALEFEYGLTSWWKTELAFEFEREPGPGMGTRFSQVTSENVFQFTQRGEYWLDAGFFFAYSHTMLKGSPDRIAFGPLLRKDFWGLSNTINLFIEQDLGVHAATQPRFLWAWETRIDAWAVNFGQYFFVEPGFQYYGAPGFIGRFNHWKDQDNRAGPQLFGRVFNLGPGTLEWNAGILVGLTSATPKITPRWQLEYEIHF